MKGKLSNVSFGGNWSEDLLVGDQLNVVLDFLSDAARCCTDTDVRGGDLDNALAYVAEKIEKGDVLADALHRAFDHKEPRQRQRDAIKVIARINRAVGN